MSFVKSVINQIGRDTGRAISNQILKDSFSTPHRNVNSYKASGLYPQKRDFTLHFEKAISFQTGFKPCTLINKIAGVYTIIKNQTLDFLADGYLDIDESDKLFEMISRFNMKIDDVCDILEIDTEANEKEINQLTAIVKKTNDLFKQALEVSADGCIKKQFEHEREAASIQPLSFTKYVFFHIIWMGKHARGEEKSLFKTIFANILDIVLLIFPLTRTYLLLKGMLTFSQENKRLNTLRNAHIQLAELEEKRANLFLELT